MIAVAEFPQIGDPVALRDDAGLIYASRVEDVGDDQITVARPADLRAALVYDVGLELDLVWTHPTGIHVVPTELADTSVERQIRLWHLAVTGAVRTEQRRDYVRVPLEGRIELDAGGDDGDDGDDDAPSNPYGEPLVGQLVDLSEVATQCTVPTDRDDARIRIGRRLRCRLTVAGVEFSLTGEVIIVRPGDGIRDCRVVVRFLLSRAESDALRKQVFAVQIAARRSRQQ